MRAYHSVPVAITLAWAGSVLAAVQAQKPKPPAQKNETKGQAQLAGANGQFGVVYTLKSGFNFEILDARYTVEPFVAYEMLKPETDKKIVVLDIAVKNTRTSDAFFNIDGLFTLVDSTGQLYGGSSLALASMGSAAPNTNLRPGQGLGQPALNDALRLGFRLPEKARIVKIMVNEGRMGRDEKVLRYYVAGATKEEAGAPGDPRNIVAALPEAVRDPADKSGATPLEEGKGVAGTYVPSGWFGLRLDSFAYTTDSMNGNPPSDGKRYAVATVTARNLTDKEYSFFDVQGGDFPMYEITTSEGDRSKPVCYRKPTRDEEPQYQFRKGDEYTFRVVFELPKDDTVKKLVLGTGGSRKWAYDVSNVK